jgi:hypothetical protein
MFHCIDYTVFFAKMCWATFWATFSQTHQVTMFVKPNRSAAGKFFLGLTKGIVSVGVFIDIYGLLQTELFRRCFH